MTDTEGDDVGDAFSERIQAARAAAGLTQAELADRAGVPLSSLTELGARRTDGPTSDRPGVLASALDIPLEELADLADRHPLRPRTPPGGYSGPGK